MVVLNNSRLIQTSIASLMVISGVVVKNSFEQAGMADNIIGKLIGMMLFILGWFYTAYITSKGKEGMASLGTIIPSLAILGSVIVMKQYKGGPPMVYPIVFAVSWMALGYFVGNHIKGWLKCLGLVAGGSVLASMMYFLPLQRKLGIVDGPGIPLFTVAWAIITFLNSYKIN